MENREEYGSFFCGVFARLGPLVARAPPLGGTTRLFLIGRLCSLGTAQSPNQKKTCSGDSHPTSI